MTVENKKENESESLKYLSLGFISLIFVIIILAVGTQLVFSPQKVTSWVRKGLEDTGLKDKLREAQINIEFEKAQTTLTGSLLYPIGIRLTDTHFSADRGCKSYDTDFKSVVVPFGIVQLIKGEFKIGSLRFNKGQTTLTDSCLESRKTTKSLDVKTANHHLEDKLIDFTKLFKEFFETVNSKDNFFNKISGALVYDWSYTFKSKSKSKDKDVKLFIERLKIYSFEKELNFKSEAKGHLSFKKDKVGFHADLAVFEDNITLTSELKYKEGSLFINNFYQKDQKPELKLSVEHLPLSILTSVFDLEAVVSKDFLRSSWLTSEQKITFADEGLTLETAAFDVETEDGKIQLSTQDLKATWLRDKKRWSIETPAKIALTKFKALDLLNVKLRKELKKVFNDFGEFDVSLNIKKDFSLDGTFTSKKQSVFLRSQGRVGVQNIISSKGQFDLDTSKNFTLTLNHVELEEGEFKGKIVFSKNRKKTVIKPSILELKFNPGLWKDVFELKSVGAITFFGEIALNDYKSEITKGESAQSLRDTAEPSNFEISMTKLQHKHWVLESPNFACTKAKALTCKVSFDKVFAQGALGLKLLKEHEEQMADFRTKISKKAELSFINKKLSLSFLYQNTDQRSLKLNWTPKLGPVLVFPDESKISFRDL